jgi:hypothetical protein
VIWVLDWNREDRAIDKAPCFIFRDASIFDLRQVVGSLLCLFHIFLN